jgi:hypothetical protein
VYLNHFGTELHITQELKALTTNAVHFNAVKDKTD